MLRTSPFGMRQERSGIGANASPSRRRALTAEFPSRATADVASRKPLQSTRPVVYPGIESSAGVGETGALQSARVGGPQREGLTVHRLRLLPAAPAAGRAPATGNGCLHPGTLVIQPQAALGGRKNLDRELGDGRRRMSDRQHRHPLLTVPRLCSVTLWGRPPPPPNRML